VEPVTAASAVPFREVGGDRTRGSNHLVGEAPERSRHPPGNADGDSSGLEGGGEGDELVGWGLEHGQAHRRSLPLSPSLLLSLPPSLSTAPCP
jgi:hypothetical protein